MPNCFQLTRNGEREPRSLKDLDNDIWFLFEGGEPEGNTKWYKDWFNYLGLSYALGNTLNETVECYKGTDLEPIAEFIATNYTVRAWYEPK